MQRSTNRRKLLAAPGWLALLLLAIGFGGTSRSAAQAPFDYSPYRIQVWIAVGSAADLTSRLQENLIRTMVERADAYAGATWELEALPAPQGLQTEMLEDIDRISAQRIEDDYRDELKRNDKLFLVSVSSNGVEYRIAVRELDCPARQLSPTIQRQLRQHERIADAAFQALADAFLPAVRIEQVDGKEAVVRPRAGGLVYGEQSPARIGAGDVLRPVIRRNDRNGEPLEGGISVVPMTYLAVTGTRGTLVDCQVYSAMSLRVALGGRRSARTQRMALLARPRAASTQLFLESRDDPPLPLPGYTVFAKDPMVPGDSPPPEDTAPQDATSADTAADTAEEDAAEETVHEETAPGTAKPPSSAAGDESMQQLGQTDWRGAVEIHSSQSPLRVLYIKSGSLVLARVPVVPGLMPIETVQLHNDHWRLEAEAFVRGFQATVTDLVVRQKVLELQLRNRLADKQLDQANAVMDKLRNLPTSADLERTLERGQAAIQSELDPSDTRTQQKIDKLFADTRQLLVKYIDAELVSRLERELAQVQQGE